MTICHIIKTGRRTELPRNTEQESREHHPLDAPRQLDRDSRNQVQIVVRATTKKWDKTEHQNTD